MPRRKIEAPPQDSVEQDFMEAIDRLQENEPKNKKLKALKAKGKLKINFTNVALEAGHSRTLIALETGCRYPGARERTKQLMSGHHGPPTTLNEVIKQLRAENLELKLQVKTHKAAVLAHFNAREKAEQEAARERAAAARLRKQIADSGKVVTMASRNSE